MAESILRLRVDSTEYENKIKRAAEGLQRYAEGCRKAGGTLTQLDEGVLEFTQALGNMNTSATSARGKLTEMTKAFTDLSIEYKQLTQEEKNAPFGKALAQSLDELKTRIQSTKQDLDEINESLNGKTSSGGGGLFSSDKLSGMLQVFGGNLMTKGAAMVASFANEMGEAVKQGIELARQGEGIRNAFERLGRGDILDGLREATHGTVTDIELMKAAVKFNDFKLPLDELGTMLSFAQQKAKDTGQSVDFLVESIVNGLGRKSLPILDNLGLSATEIRERMKETGDMTKAVGEIIREQMSKAGDYVETAADRAAQADVKLQNAMEELGRTFQPLSDSANNMWNDIKVGALNLLNNAVRPLIDALTEAGRIRAQFAQQGGDKRVNRQLGTLGNIHSAQYRRNTYNAQLSNYDTKIGSYNQYLSDYKTWQSDKTAVGAYDRMQAFQKQTGLSMYSDVKEQLEVFKRMRAEYVMGAKSILEGNPAPSPTSTTVTTTTKGGRSSSNLPSMGDFDKALAKSLTGSVDLKEVKDALSPYQMMLPEIKKNILDIKDADLGGALAMKGERQVKQEIEDINKSLIQQQKAYQLAGQAAMSFGAALQGIQDPATKAAGTVVQAVASIALGFATASAQANTAGTGWGWLAWLAAGASAMATTIATIHSLTGYAQGGMVKGNSYSGDNIPAMVDGSQMVGLNAGEVVLNAAQQQTLAGRLQNGGGGGINVVGEIQGEKIVLVANRYFRRTGQGEIVTW